MAGHNQCCRYEVSLEELLADDIMRPVLQSAGYDRERFRDLIVETGERFRQSRDNEERDW